MQNSTKYCFQNRIYSQLSIKRSFSLPDRCFKLFREFLIRNIQPVCWSSCAMLYKITTRHDKRTRLRSLAYIISSSGYHSLDLFVRLRAKNRLKHSRDSLHYYFVINSELQCELPVSIVQRSAYCWPVLPGSNRFPDNAFRAFGASSITRKMTIREWEKSRRQSIRCRVITRHVMPRIRGDDTRTSRADTACPCARARARARTHTRGTRAWTGHGKRTIRNWSKVDSPG